MLTDNLLLSLAVWLVTNPDLYYPLCVKKQTHVCLWKADIENRGDGLIIKEHPTFKGICEVELEVSSVLLPL